MAYDAKKAHDYYVQYRKKGLLKGRKLGTKAEGADTSAKKTKKKGSAKKGKKKGAAKKTKQENLVGLSSSGLNDAGKMEAAMAKESLKKEMNEALGKAKTDAEKAQIKKDFQAKALKKIQDIKANSQFATPKKESKAKTSSKTPKKTKDSPKKSKKSSKKTKASVAQSSTSSASSTVTASPTQEITNAMNERLDVLEQRLDSLTTEQKEQVKTELTDVLAQLKKMLGTKNG